MAKLTIVVGVLLVATGVGGWVMTGSTHPTALIPSYIGIVLAVAGTLAMAPARRMLWMHIAVTVGLLGFLGTAKSIFDVARGVLGEHPMATYEKLMTSLICLLFTGLCVRSFIAARRNRVAETA